MAEPTLLQQARENFEAAGKWVGERRHVLERAAVHCILQHLEQQQAATRGPAQVPSEQQVNDLIREASAHVVNVAIKTQGPIVPRCAECGGDREYWPHSTKPPTGEMHHPFRPSDPPALDLDELQRLCDAATPGPWEYDDDAQALSYDILGHLAGWVCAVHELPLEGACTRERNAAFIGAARDALPKLIARVRQLEQRIDKVNALGNEFASDPATALRCIGEHLDLADHYDRHPNVPRDHG